MSRHAPQQQSVGEAMAGVAKVALGALLIFCISTCCVVLLVSAR